MEPRPHYLMVGIFVLLMASLGVVLILWFSKIELMEQPNLYAIYFQGSVTGLRENEEVKFRGVPIGKIRKITVDKTTVDKVRVLISVYRPELIRVDSVATIEAQGLTGYSYVQITGSTPESPILEVQPGQKYPVIQSKPSGIESLFAEMPHILENLNNIAKKLNTFLDEKTVVNMQQTIQNIQKVTGELSQGPRSLSLMVQDMREGMKRVAKAGDDFSVLSNHLEQVLAENRQAIHSFTDQGLPNLTRFLEKAQNTAESIGRVAEDLEKGPAQFLRKTTTGGYKIE